MSGQYLGDFVGDETMVVVFDSFDSNGASVTITGLATTDIEIYKGSSITQRASDSGYTLIDTDGIDIDGATGIHGFTVDLSDNTDAGFYATGNDYYIVVNAITIDTQTVRFIAARFSIQNRYMRGTDSAFLAASSANLVDDIWDETLTGATHNVPQSAGRRLRGIQDFQGYEDGSIWINTVNGSAGTTDYENGTVENQVNTLSDANTLNTSLGFDSFHIAPSSSLTFAATQSGQAFTGSEWTLALGGQNIANTTIEGAIVSGIGTGSGSSFINCEIGATTTAPGRLGWCGFTGTWTIGAAGDFYLHDCYSQVAGLSTPIFDLGAGVGATNLSIRRWSGGLTLNNVAAGDIISVDVVSGGTITINGTGGSVYIRGICDVTDGSGGSVTIVETSVLNRTDLSFDVWDEVLTGVTHNIANSAGKRIRDLQEFGTYEGGAVFIDTINGMAGTTDYESGTNLNPVDTITDANTIAASLTLSRFEVAPRSSITFSSSQMNQVFNGVSYTIALGGQDISNTEFIGAQEISGTATTPTGEAHFFDCELVTGTLGQSHFRFCGMQGTISLSAAADYTMSDCYSKTINPVIIDFGAAVGSTNLSVRRFSGNMEVQNYGATGTDTMTIEGNGSLVVNANCVGGIIYYRGDFNLVDNSGGAVTFSKDDNTQNIEDILADTSTTIPGILGTPTDTDLATDIANVQTDANDIQTRVPTTAELAYIVSNSADGVPVTFTGGTTTTAVLSTVDGAPASSIDDFYNGRIFIFNSGSLQYQATDIVDYDGATKTATITAVTTAVTSSHAANMK